MVKSNLVDWYGSISWVQLVCSNNLLNECSMALCVFDYQGTPYFDTSLKM